MPDGALSLDVRAVEGCPLPYRRAGLFDPYTFTLRCTISHLTSQLQSGVRR